MPDMTPIDMQKKGSATSVFQRIAEVALQYLVVFRISFALVRVPCDKTIIKACPNLQFCLYCCGTCDGTGTRYRSKIVAHTGFARVSRSFTICMICETTHIKVIKIETC